MQGACAGVHWCALTPTRHPARSRHCQDHFGFRAAWRSCPSATALKHLDVVSAGGGLEGGPGGDPVQQPACPSGSPALTSPAPCCTRAPLLMAGRAPAVQGPVRAGPVGWVGTAALGRGGPGRRRLRLVLHCLPACLQRPWQASCPSTLLGPPPAHSRPVGGQAGAVRQRRLPAWRLRRVEALARRAALGGAHLTTAWPPVALTRARTCFARSLSARVASSFLLCLWL